MIHVVRPLLLNMITWICMAAFMSCINDLTDDHNSRVNSEVYGSIFNALIQPNHSIATTASMDFFRTKTWNVLDWPSQAGTQKGYIGLDSPTVMSRVTAFTDFKQSRRLLCNNFIYGSLFLVSPEQTGRLCIKICKNPKVKRTFCTLTWSLFHFKSSVL